MIAYSLETVKKISKSGLQKGVVPAFNAAYAEYFPDNPPARSTAESRLMIDIAVEIEAIAYKPA